MRPRGKAKYFRLLLGPFLCLAVLLTPTGRTYADVTDGGGSADFLLKTYVAGQSGPPQQETYDATNGWKTNNNPIGGVLTQSPAVATYNGQFWVIGLGQDQQLYYNYYNPTTAAWSGWGVISLPYPSGSQPFTSAPSIAVYAGYLQVFVRGSNNGLWQATYGNGTWTGWYAFTGANTVGSAPAVVTYTGNGERNELHVFYLGYGSNTIYDEVYNQHGGSSQWSSPIALPGAYTSAPAAAPYGGTLQMWADGLNQEVYQSIYNYNGAQSWQVFAPYSSDVAGSAPAITEYDVGSDRQFQVFYVMGDASNTWETKQLVYDPNRGGWQAPVDQSDMSSAPAVAQFGTQLQIWWRDPPVDDSSIHITGFSCGTQSQGTSLVHTYDVGCTGGAGEKWAAVSAQWENNTLLSQSVSLSDFIDQELWALTTNGGFNGTADVMEVGLSSGGYALGCGTGNACGNEYIFWADTLGGYSTVHEFQYYSPDGSKHTYELQGGGGGGNWWVYDDGLALGNASDQSGDAAYGAEVGFEAAHIESDLSAFHSATFHDVNLQAEQYASPYGWSPWIYMNTNNDMPCPKNQNGSYWGNCMNGHKARPDRWYVNKP